MFIKASKQCWLLNLLCRNSAAPPPEAAEGASVRKLPLTLLGGGFVSLLCSWFASPCANYDLETEPSAASWGQETPADPGRSPLGPERLGPILFAANFSLGPRLAECRRKTWVTVQRQWSKVSVLQHVAHAI